MTGEESLHDFFDRMHAEKAEKIKEGGKSVDIFLSN